MRHFGFNGRKLGTGSPNTINPLLDAWWKKLSARLDAGPAALHRLPESVAHAAEALWMQALDEGRRRAAQETHATTRALTTDKQTLEVRAHVLSLRESELESRLHDRERRQAAIEAQLQDLATLLRKEQATRDSQAKRIATLEAQLLLRPLAVEAPALARHGESGAEARPKRVKQGGRPAKALKRTPGRNATTRRRR